MEQQYEVKQDMVQGGRVLRAGDRVWLTARQARYLRLGGFIEPAAVEEPEAGDDSLDTREDRIRAAIGRLDAGADGHWTGDGRPEVRALREHGAPGDLSARERDDVWAALQAGRA